MADSMNRPLLIPIVACVCLGFANGAASQGFSASDNKPRAWSRVSFFATSSRTDVDGTPHADLSEFTTAFTYQLPDVDEVGPEYGADLRYATYSPGTRPSRVSIYEGFAGARLAGGTVRFRAGHVWLNDLGSLGSLAGGLIEVRQKRILPDAGRFRVGAFAGLEPNVLDAGYASHVKKFGGYLGYDGAGARRHSLGYVTIRDGPLTERAVLTTTNFLPLGRKLFVYQAAEYDTQSPAGQAPKGLTYLFGNVRMTPTERVDVQGTYNRGRSVDARGLGEDILSGRPIAQTSLDGLLYESIGGRLTVEAVRRVRLYAGYSRDKNNRDTDPTGRTQIGAYASSVAGSGFDVTVSDSLMQRAAGGYHSRYLSIGRQLGRRAYAYGDYSTSLSVVRFSRSDGITIETRPYTTRLSGTATINLGRSASLLATVERTRQDQVREFRVLTGLTYRIR